MDKYFSVPRLVVLTVVMKNSGTYYLIKGCLPQVQLVIKTLLLHPLQSNTGPNLLVDKMTPHSIESSEIQIPLV